MLLGGALALGRGFDFKSHKSRCLSIFLIISGSSMKDKIFILPFGFVCLILKVTCLIFSRMISDGAIGYKQYS